MALLCDSPGSLRVGIYLQNTWKSAEEWNSSMRKLTQISLSLHFQHQLLTRSLTTSTQYHLAVDILSKCTTTTSTPISHGQASHAHFIKSGAYSLDNYHCNYLINMYAKRKLLKVSRHVFDEMQEPDIVSWSALIGGYAHMGNSSETMDLYKKMLSKGLSQIIPNQFTFSNLLKGCANSDSVEHGMQIHTQIMKFGYDPMLDFRSCLFVGSGLLEMYGKCGEIFRARKVFDKMPSKDAVTWSSMVAVYVQNNLPSDALRLFLEMLDFGVSICGFVLSSVLKACAFMAALKQGKQVHGQVIIRGVEGYVFVGSALVDMYSKCGDMDDSALAFWVLDDRNVVSWNSLLVGYAHHGQGEKVMKVFSEMRKKGVSPNGITFVGVLFACVHMGNVELGTRMFEAMKTDYGIVPKKDHYGCMVRLFGKAGDFESAEGVIKDMPFAPDFVIWRILLSACVSHGNTELGRVAARKVLDLRPQDDSTYVMLSNMLASAGMWEEVSKVRKMMRDSGVRKIAGTSWVQIHDKMHCFVVDDVGHPQKDEIYGLLEELGEKMKEHGYVIPRDARKIYGHDDVRSDETENCISYHSEKLALACALLNTPSGGPIRIIKNLRVCGDCHFAFKVISKIVGREIVLRDFNLFHSFKDGVCSCGDYW